MRSKGCVDGGNKCSKLSTDYFNEKNKVWLLFFVNISTIYLTSTVIQDGKATRNPKETLHKHQKYQIKDLDNL